MIFEFDEAERRPQFARIRVVGVGGGGGNAVNRMIQEKLDGVEFISINTDAQALLKAESHRRLQIGKQITRGLGAGARPEVGREAMLEDRDEVIAALEGSDMVFITAGLGGGTGTGAAPVLAEIAKEMGALTVGIVTKPFAFEGRKRMQQAEEGLRDLKKRVDTLIVVPNQRLLSVVGQGTSLQDAFRVADSVLLHATQGISDLITVTGLVNVDFADVKTIMTEMGDALMGTGYGSGEHRAIEAAQEAISSPLLDEVSISGARGVLINITGGRNLSLHEVSDVSSVIHEAAGEEANIIFGAVIDSEMADELRVTVIATGINSAEERHEPRHDRSNIVELTPRREEEFAVAAAPPRREASHHLLFQSEVVDEGTRADLEIPTFIRRQMD
ncbi:MAG: cell division protein FtsZ [Gemmatimonadetes bacterium]|nr:cell division protein FtsZ [Gemmatimonadota bacterium]